MQMYQQAYQIYQTKCEMYGMEGIDFSSFLSNITEDQMQMMLQEAN